MKKIICFLLVFISFMFMFGNKAQAVANSEVEVKYYDNLVSGEKVVTILLENNTASRKITKEELILRDNLITEIKEQNGTVVGNGELVKTGDIAVRNTTEYKVVLYGDANKDGYVCDVDDIMVIINDWKLTLA